MKEGLIGTETQTVGSEVNSNAEAVKVKSSFVTTPELLKQLNMQLSDLSVYDGTGSVHQEQKARSKLQKRLPNDSTMAASEYKTPAANFKTKLEHSAKFISQLDSSKDRQYWAEQQRLTGNALFHKGDFKNAMDVYLMCLVVKENTPDFLRDTFLPVLNNLAQCTLQLGMHMKTILLCEMALEEVSKAKGNVTNEKDYQEEKKFEKIDGNEFILMQKDLIDAIALCKILFKLAKALRLTGHYRKAREALHSSLDCLIREENQSIASLYATSGEAQFSLVPYKMAISKEFRCLDIAKNESRKNLARQKIAMQTVLPSLPIPKSILSQMQQENKSQERSLLSDYFCEDSLETAQCSKRRALSSIVQQNDDMTAYSDHNCEEKSYSHYYWSMVERVVKAFLVMLGDHGDVGKEEVSIFNSEDVRMGKKRT